MMKPDQWFLIAFMLWLCAWLGGAALPAAIAANTPTKLTVMAPMRDGVHLATDVHLPAGDGPWPVALTRTAYGRVNGGAISNRVSIQALVGNGIAVISQDTTSTR
jgi:predicted acyl esterase